MAVPSRSVTPRSPAPVLLSPGSTGLTVDNIKVENWTFEANNQLTFETDAGHSVCIQVVLLGTGPIIIGDFRDAETEASQRKHPP